MPTDPDTIVSHNNAEDAVAQATAAQVDGSERVAAAEERDRLTGADLRGINQKLNEDNQLLFQVRVRYISMYMYMYMYISIYICICIYIYGYMHVCVYIHACVYMCIYVCIYICVSMYII